MKPFLISISLVLLLAFSLQAKADSIGLICVNQLKEEPPRIFNIDLGNESWEYFNYAGSKWKSFYRVKVTTERVTLEGDSSNSLVAISRINLSMKADLDIDFEFSKGHFKGSCAPKPISALTLVAQRELDKLNNKRAF